MNKQFNRREFLLLAGSLGLSLYGANYLFGDSVDFFDSPVQAVGSGIMAYAKGNSPAEITRAAVNKIGGMKKIVSAGDVVVLKPNIGWDRAPGYGANTTPEVVGTVAKMCFEAGAKKVKIVDNPCVDPQIAYNKSGMMKIAKAVKADIHFLDERSLKNMNIKGKKIKNWPVYTELVNANKLINIPIAKDHGLSKLSLGMKNWYGGVGGDRGSLHQFIHASIADLAAFFKPELTVVDLTKVLVANGPQGGNLADVKAFNIVIASTDPVAADAFAATFFGYKPSDIEYIKLGYQYGLGQIDYKKCLAS